MSKIDLLNYCPKCGHILTRGQNVCPNCEHKIDDDCVSNPEDAKSVLIILIALLVVVGLIYLIKKSFF